jgi:hypothetical protein
VQWISCHRITPASALLVSATPSRRGRVRRLRSGSCQTSDRTFVAYSTLKPVKTVVLGTGPGVLGGWVGFGFACCRRICVPKPGMSICTPCSSRAQTMWPAGKESSLRQWCLGRAPERDGTFINHLDGGTRGREDMKTFLCRSSHETLVGGNT